MSFQRLDLLKKLDLAREIAGVPMYISDDYRTNAQGAHSYGMAVDVVDDYDSDGITSAWRYEVVRAACAAGFTRIGVYDKHIHLDIWDGGPQRVMWMGESA